MPISEQAMRDAGYGSALPGTTLERVRKISYLLDSCFVLPGFGWRFGIDPLLGLFPGIGDMIEAAIGLYLLTECASLGIPASLKLRMAGNLVLDWLIGIVPFAGSLFNAGFKAHRRNLRLLERFLERNGGVPR